jgi:hypothetical protein
MKSARLAPLSGIAFVVLLIVGIVAVSGNTPSIDDPATKIASYYGDHKSKETIAVIMIGLASVFLTIFAVSLRNFLTGAGRDGSAWPTVALIGGVVSVAGIFFAGAIHLALVNGGDKNISPEAMVAVNAIDADSLLAFVVPLGIMLIGVAGATLGEGGGLPKWMGWVALVLGIIFFTPLFWASMLLTFIWIIVASILMYRRAGAAATA